MGNFFSGKEFENVYNGDTFEDFFWWRRWEWVMGTILNDYMVGCQNHGPLLPHLYSTAAKFRGMQELTII